MNQAKIDKRKKTLDIDELVLFNDNKNRTSLGISVDS